MRAIFALALTSCTASRAETAIGALYLGTNSLIVCDYGQTIWSANGGRWDRPGFQPGDTRIELNPVLGEKPSPEKLTAWFGADVAANTAVLASPLPRWTRLAWFGTIALVETYLVAEHFRYPGGQCGL